VFYAPEGTAVPWLAFVCRRDQTIGVVWSRKFFCQALIGLNELPQDDLFSGAPSRISSLSCGERVDQEHGVQECSFLKYRGSSVSRLLMSCSRAMRSLCICGQ
jgi:hypothetical protein